MIEWNNSFLTGHACVDNDHKRLIIILNELEAALKSGKATEELHRVILSLSDYAAEHFAREEALMDKVCCPSRGQNCEEHAALLKRVEAWKLRLGDGEGASLALEVFRECNAWITGHILRVDCQLRGCRAEGFRSGE